MPEVLNSPKGPEPQWACLLLLGLGLDKGIASNLRLTLPCKPGRLLFWKGYWFQPLMRCSGRSCRPLGTSDHKTLVLKPSQLFHVQTWSSRSFFCPELGTVWSVPSYRHPSMLRVKTLVSYLIPSLSYSPDSAANSSLYLHNRSRIWLLLPHFHLLPLWSSPLLEVAVPVSYPDSLTHLPLLQSNINTAASDLIKT